MRWHVGVKMKVTLKLLFTRNLLLLIIWHQGTNNLKQLCMVKLFWNEEVVAPDTTLNSTGQVTEADWTKDSSLTNLPSCDFHLVSVQSALSRLRERSIEARVGLADLLMIPPFVCVFTAHNFIQTTCCWLTCCYSNDFWTRHFLLIFIHYCVKELFNIASSSGRT